MDLTLAADATRTGLTVETFADVFYVVLGGDLDIQVYRYAFLGSIPAPKC